jgi:hypothetical protein
MKPYPFCEDVEVYGICVRVSGTYIPGDPGRLSGPPEKCWPPEPDEVEIERIEHAGEDIGDACSVTFWDLCAEEVLRAMKDDEK